MKRRATTTLLEAKSLQQDNNNFQPEEEITKHNAKIVFNEWGYTYSGITEVNGSNIKVNDNNNISNRESGNKGEVEEKTETWFVK